MEMIECCQPTGNRGGRPAVKPTVLDGHVLLQASNHALQSCAGDQGLGPLDSYKKNSAFNGIYPSGDRVCRRISGRQEFCAEPWIGLEQISNLEDLRFLGGQKR